MYRITQLKVPLDYQEADLPRRIASYLKVSENSILSWKYHKKSIDARKKEQLGFVLSLDVDLKPGYRWKPAGKTVHRSGGSQVIRVSEKQYAYPQLSAKGERYLATHPRPVVVGSGPAGLFAGLTLAVVGLRPIILERGRAVEDRVRDVDAFIQTGKLQPESNVQFGEGGAGTFSDGKLTTGIKDLRIRQVLKEFYQAGATESILYDAKPHIGTDVLRTVLVRLREKIMGLGGEFLFESKLTDLRTENGRLAEIHVSSRTGNIAVFPAEYVILAPGHSARDTFALLLERGFSMTQKPFSMGVRIEHKQSFIDQMQYGAFAGHDALGAADYKLAVHLQNGRGVYTFCMCPGGFVVPASSEEGRLCVNGMSRFARDGENANSAVLVSLTPEDFASEHPLEGMYFQRQIETKAYELGGGGYRAPVQLAGDFVRGKETHSLQEVEPTYPLGYQLANMGSIFPAFMVQLLQEGLLCMNKSIAGFTENGAVLTGVEARSSSPVRILRDPDTMQSSITGVFPCGEGAGYAGGIMSAAVDGMKAAEALVKAIEAWQ